MKKFWTGIVVFAFGAIALTVFNNVYLLWNHPLSYYYTVEGMLASTKLVGVEAAIVTPLAIIGGRYFFGKEAKEYLSKRKES